VVANGRAAVPAPEISAPSHRWGAPGRRRRASLDGHPGSAAPRGRPRVLDCHTRETPRLNAGRAPDPLARPGVPPSYCAGGAVGVSPRVRESLARPLTSTRQAVVPPSPLGALAWRRPAAGEPEERGCRRSTALGAVAALSIRTRQANLPGPRPRVCVCAGLRIRAFSRIACLIKQPPCRSWLPRGEFSLRRERDRARPFITIAAARMCTHGRGQPRPVALRAGLNPGTHCLCQSRVQPRGASTLVSSIIAVMLGAAAAYDVQDVDTLWEAPAGPLWRQGLGYGKS